MSENELAQWLQEAVADDVTSKGFAIDVERRMLALEGQIGALESERDEAREAARAIHTSWNGDWYDAEKRWPWLKEVGGD